MTVLNTTRFVLFATTICFSVIVLGILANFTSSITEPAFSLGLATSVMSLLAIPASLIIERFRRGAITSFVWVELFWVGWLWVLWLATAGSLVDLGGAYLLCGWDDSELGSLCHQYQAVEAFSFLNWLVLLGWWITLLAISIRAVWNGISEVWSMPVTEHPGWSKNATSPYGQSTPVNYPTVPVTNYGSPAPGQPQPGYGMQQPYGTPQLQQGYGSPQVPQPTYGMPAPGSPPGSPYGSPQQLGFAGKPAQPYPAFPEPQV